MKSIQIAQIVVGIAVAAFVLKCVIDLARRYIGYHPGKIVLAIKARVETIRDYIDLAQRFFRGER